MPNARYVKGFVVGNKSDFNDAQAILDAVIRPNTRVVAVKALEQRDMQLLHNSRQLWVGQRTTLDNQLWSLLSGRGLINGPRARSSQATTTLILEDAENGLPRQS